MVQIARRIDEHHRAHTQRKHREEHAERIATERDVNMLTRCGEIPHPPGRPFDRPRTIPATCKNGGECARQHAGCGNIHQSQRYTRCAVHNPDQHRGAHNS